MATGKRYYWMKLKDSFMTSDEIDYIMSQKDGANYVVLYQMLCLKTINTDGRLLRQIGEITIPYDIPKIQKDLKWFSTRTIRAALELFKTVGLLYEDRDGTLVLVNHAEMVGSETDWADKKRRQTLQAANSLPATGESTGDTTGENFPTEIRDKRIEIRDIENRDKSTDKEDREDNSEKREASQEESFCPYSQIRDLYHQICISYPAIRAIDGNRRKAVAARWRTYRSLDTFENLFRLAEASPFLKGENERNWFADFDWMMKPTNFTKILERKYEGQRSNEFKTTNNVFDTLQRMHEEARRDDEAGSS